MWSVWSVWLCTCTCFIICIAQAVVLIRNQCKHDVMYSVNVKHCVKINCCIQHCIQYIHTPSHCTHPHTSHTLTLHTPSHFTHPHTAIPASITTPLPSPQLAFMERSLQLTCVADGAPPPSYIWTKESVPLANNLAFEVSDSGLLTIVTVDISSGGNYTCVATNAVGGQVVGSASTSTIVTAIGE